MTRRYSMASPEMSESASETLACIEIKTLLSAVGHVVMLHCNRIYANEGALDRKSYQLVTKLF